MEPFRSNLYLYHAIQMTRAMAEMRVIFLIVLTASRSCCAFCGYDWAFARINSNGSIYLPLETFTLPSLRKSNKKTKHHLGKHQSLASPQPIESNNLRKVHPWSASTLIIICRGHRSDKSDKILHLRNDTKVMSWKKEIESLKSSWWYFNRIVINSIVGKYCYEKENSEEKREKIVDQVIWKSFQRGRRQCKFVRLVLT